MSLNYSAGSRNRHRLGCLASRGEVQACRMTCRPELPKLAGMRMRRQKGGQMLDSGMRLRRGAKGFSWIWRLPRSIVAEPYPKPEAIRLAIFLSGAGAAVFLVLTRLSGGAGQMG